MAETQPEKSQIQIIAELNDNLRQNFQGGEIMMTRAIAELKETTRLQVLQAVQNFSDFNPENDPYKEHDFGAVEVENERYFWKIDYYNQGQNSGSEDPSNPEITRRVMTIMQASEY